MPAETGRVVQPPAFVARGTRFPGDFSVFYVIIIIFIFIFIIIIIIVTRCCISFGAADLRAHGRGTQKTTAPAVTGRGDPGINITTRLGVRPVSEYFCANPNHFTMYRAFPKFSGKSVYKLSVARPNSV